jgi:hypothetical protein
MKTAMTLTFLVFTIICTGQDKSLSGHVFCKFKTGSNQTDTQPISNAAVTIRDSDTDIPEGPFYSETSGKFITKVNTYGSMLRVQNQI